MLESHSPPASFAPFAHVLETMAFISPEPIHAPEQAPPELLMARIVFSGPSRGAVEVVASEAFAVLLAANVLGSSTEDPGVSDGAGDALKELVNVTCGALLATRAGDTAAPFQLGLPELASFDGVSGWRSFVQSPGTAVFDADGYIVAIRVSGAA